MPVAGWSVFRSYCECAGHWNLALCNQGNKGSECHYRRALLSSAVLLCSFSAEQDLLLDWPSSIWGTFVGVLKHCSYVKCNQKATEVIWERKITQISRCCSELISSRLYLKMKINKNKMTLQASSRRSPRASVQWAKLCKERFDCGKRWKKWQYKEAGPTTVEWHGCTVMWQWSQDGWQMSHWSDRLRCVISHHPRQAFSAAPVKLDRRGGEGRSILPMRKDSFRGCLHW